jgi:hypothetical protein
MWALEGSLERTVNSTHYVSLYYIPGGCEHMNAKLTHVFFESESAAKVFAAKWQNIPEMAMIGNIEDYDRIVKTCRMVYQ